MSKIVKKADLDVLIESTIKTAGIEVPKKKKIVTESKVVKKETPKTEVIKESKEYINENIQNELNRFNKLTNFKY
jgi:hypothetical protein